MEWERRRMSHEEENGTGEENGVLKWTPLFDKAVTPSDVGKLNRLVIPKQQAEKYFPMAVHSNDKGLLLTFHDTAGKPWRFRYSYWNSSQSYVLTKGWSRFVKDKRLVAGDIVSFHRGTSEARQLYIACRSRPLSLKQPAPPVVKGFGFPSATACYNPHWMQVFWPRLGHMEGLVCPAADPVAVSRPQMNGDAEEPRAKRKEVRVFGVDLAVSRSLGGPMHFPS